MNKYAKLINDTQIEMAPLNKGAILNYNLNLELLRQDGFKEVIENSYPNDNKKYIIKYRAENNKIIQFFEEIIPSYETQRKSEYPELGDMIDAFCKAENGEKEELNRLLAKRNEIKNKYPKA